MWNHESELFGIRTKTHALRIVPRDRISLLRAHNVGAARDMFLALLNGAALITLDLDESGLAALAKWLRAEAVSVFTCVATIFRHAVHGLSVGDRFPAVRLIHIGGEPIFKADVELYKKYFSDDCLFVSRYSISETQAVSYFLSTRTAQSKIESRWAIRSKAIKLPFSTTRASRSRRAQSVRSRFGAPILPPVTGANRN